MEDFSKHWEMSNKRKAICLTFHEAVMKRITWWEKRQQASAALQNTEDFSFNFEKVFSTGLWHQRHIISSSVSITVFYKNKSFSSIDVENTSDKV